MRNPRQFNNSVTIKDSINVVEFDGIPIIS